MNALISKITNFGPSHPTPPGPDFLENLTYQYDFIRDQEAMFRRLFEEYGRVAYLRLGGFDNYVVLEPELMEEILLKKWDSFRKDVITQELGQLVGRGLLTSEGETWRTHRKMLAPPLQRRQIARYAEIMVSQTERMIERWADGERRKFDRDVMEITLRIVVQTLFDLDLEHRIERVEEAVDDAMAYMDELAHSLWRFVPDPIPTPMEGAFEEAVDEFDEIVYDLIESRRERGDPGDDLLYQLIEARGEEGEKLSDEQLRDHVITLFLAGHETTALAITYAWYLLTQLPDRAARVRDEVDEVLGDERATAEDARKLPFVEAVFKESMRMYPPVWIIGREAVEEVEIGEWRIPGGAQVLMPQCVGHRDPEWFDDPDTFRPERWLGDLEDELPRFAYFPFGGGPRICIGNYFAEMEAVLVIATMAQHVEFDNEGPESLETTTAITQRPTEPVEMRIRKRR